MSKSELRTGDDLAGNKSAIEEAAALTRQMADDREAVQRQKKTVERPPLHLIPMNDDDTSKAWDSTAWIAERDAAEEARQQKLADEENKKYTYYLKCRKPHHAVGGRTAQPHGVYFRMNPFGKQIGDHDWFSTYKKIEQVWRQPLLCQVCLKMGFEEELSYTWVQYNRGVWTPDPRWVWKVPNDVKVWDIEGDTRAWDLVTASSNMWRDEVAAKHAKAEQLAAKGA